MWVNKFRASGVFLLVLLSQICGGQDGGLKVQIVYPGQNAIVVGLGGLEMRCRFDGLLGAEHAVAIDVDEVDGGEFPIAADGEYSFTLPPLADGVHEVGVILLQTNMVRTRQSVIFESSSSAPPSPSPTPKEEVAPTHAITGPSQCQALPAGDVTILSTISDFGGVASAETAKLTLEINAHHQPMSIGPQSLNVAQMPKGLHVLFLRAEWTSDSGEQQTSRSGPVWFGVGMDFTIENVESRAEQEQQGPSDLLAQAILYDRLILSHSKKSYAHIFVNSDIEILEIFRRIIQKCVISNTATHYNTLKNSQAH